MMTKAEKFEKVMFCNNACPYDIEMFTTLLRKLGMNLRIN